MKISAMTEPFLRDLLAHGKSQKTYKTYLSHFAILSKCPFLEDDLRSLTAEKLHQYAGWLATWKGPKTRGEGLSVNSIHGCLSSLASFCRWLKKRKFIKENPADELEGVKRPKKLPRAVPMDWIERVLALPLSARDRALLTIMWTCGLRRGELVNLDLEDVNVEDGVLLVRNGKGGMDRALPLPADAKSAVQAWAGQRGSQAGPLFIGCRGQRLGQYGVGLVLASAAKKAGLGHLTPHQLRHTWGTEAVKAGVNIEAIREAMGHASLTTTQRYLHVTAVGMQEAFARLTEVRMKRIIEQAAGGAAATKEPAKSAC
jgi:site-specific recombinase XerC